jgi:hypothetical protein
MTERYGVPLIHPRDAREIAGDRLVHCSFGSLGLNDVAVQVVSDKLKHYGAEVLGLHCQGDTIASIMYGRKL